MDPFTQRMLERARARQEKIDQKLANSGQIVPKRKPLSENTIKNQASPIKNSRQSISSPKKTFDVVNNETPSKKVNQSNQVVPAQQRPRNDVIVTKKEFKSPKRGSLNRRNSDVSVEINISHRNDIQIEVQVEERDAPISIIYDPCLERGQNVVIQEIEDDTSKPTIEKKAIDMADTKTDRSAMRHNMKSRLDRLGNLYSDNPNLSSPIHRTEQEFTSATPPSHNEPVKPRVDNKKKFGRLAALADQINNWEDDLTHHSHLPETKQTQKDDKMDASTLDVSIHSFKDINKVLSSKVKSEKNSKFNTHTFKKPSVNECQRLEKNIVAELVSNRVKKCASKNIRHVEMTLNKSFREQRLRLVPQRALHCQ